MGKKPDKIKGIAPNKQVISHREATRGKTPRGVIEREVFFPIKRKISPIATAIPLGKAKAKILEVS